MRVGEMCVVLAALLLRAAVRASPLHLLAHRSGPQQQLPELQQLQSLQRDSVLGALSVPPVIILLAQAPAAAEQRARRGAHGTNAHGDLVDEDLESVMVEADPEEPGSRRPLVLVLPGHARLSIGDVISAIPFLPIEVNVPDAVGWAYGGISSGISSIISIFGRRPAASPAAPPAGPVPVLVMPVAARAVPIHLPIQVQ